MSFPGQPTVPRSRLRTRECGGSIGLVTWIPREGNREGARGSFRALTRDLAAAHVAPGILLQKVDFNWRGAEAEYRRAMALAPDDGAANSGTGTSSRVSVMRSRRSLSPGRRSLPSHCGPTGSCGPSVISRTQPPR
jgi:hypothetical protein